MSSSEIEKEKCAIKRLDKFCKEHNEKGTLVEAIHKKLFGLNLADLVQVNTYVDTKIRTKKCKIVME